MKASKKISSTVGPRGIGYANGGFQFDKFNGFDFNLGTDDRYGLDSDRWGDPGWEWGRGALSEPSSFIPRGSGWGAPVGSGPSYEPKAVTKPKWSVKNTRHATQAMELETENDVTSGGGRNWDDVSTWVFHALMVYLPNPYADSPAPFDFVPHPSICALLQLSYLPETLGTLLRNDSVADWIARSETCQTMLRLLRRLGDCELTIRVLISQGWSKTKSCGIGSFIRGDSEVVWERDEAGYVVRTAPLYNHFEKLAKQSTAYLTGVTTIASDIGETGVEEISLCGDIIAAKEALDRCIAVVGGTPGSVEVRGDERTGRAPSNDGELNKLYERECARLAFKHVTISEDGPTRGLVYRTFHYRNMVETSSNDTRIPKDRLHILKELAVMGTALPPGIWVRVDEVRNDVM